MKAGPRRHWRAGVWFAAALTGALAAATIAQAAPPPGTLPAFESARELRAYLRKVGRASSGASYGWEEGIDEIIVTGARAPVPSITNNQEAGVDEGGIAKLHGDTLVILRRGRLFTVSLTGGTMRLVDMIDAFPPGVDTGSDWYDEMLVAGDRVIVIGYSYGRGGTEINRFRIDAGGRLTFEDAHHVRSDDYFSSRNYASRLIGDRLIFYTPLELDWDDDPLEVLPSLRRWRGDDDEAFKRIADARRVFIPPRLLRSREAVVDTLHTLVTCDLSAPALQCSATAVLGAEARSFYVSSEAIYLWVSDAWGYERKSKRASAFVYRLPFKGEPSAVAARGAPIDQFSFREDAGERILNVMLNDWSKGDAMFAPELSDGSAPALVRLRLSDFGDGSREAPRSRYRALPPAGDGWSLRNRFVGDHLLYGSGNGHDEGDRSVVIAAPVLGGPAITIPLSHRVDRIELLGSDALVVGPIGENLGLTAIDLAATPRTGDRFLLPEASEGEARSHAFFFRPDESLPNGRSGLLGLPVAREVDARYERFFGSSAAMLFLTRADRRLSAAGELAARPARVESDGCRASCTDWYGNARPIFVGDRIFALLGYELVEGVRDGAGIREVGRVDFAPRSADGK